MALTISKWALPAVLLSLAATPAGAGQCDDELAALDQAIAAADVSSERRAELEDMRIQAGNLCAADNQGESLDVIAEARALLDAE